MKKLFLVLLLLLTCWSTPLVATTLAEYHFDTPEQKEEFRRLSEQLRCMVCQNESLAGSDAELAQDLRREVYNMMKSGQTEEQIIDFMVSRYGDFVLYEPPFKPSTYPLWIGPFILFAIGCLLLIRTLSKKKRSHEVELSEEEQQRLDELLKQSPENQETPK